MVNMTLAIPEELHELMKKHPEIKWTEVARKAINEQAEKMKKLEWMNNALKNSNLTEKDAELIGEDLKKKILERLLKEKAARNENRSR